MFHLHHAATSSACTAILAGSALCACWVMTGCESAAKAFTRSGHEVSLADFAADPTTIELDEERVSTQPQASGSTASSPPVTLEAASTPSGQSAPEELGGTSLPAGSRRVIVDSLVGQVNGRPIFANDFFLPIADQLRALGRRSTQREFLSQAQPIIMEHLRQIVLNELFLAEAQSQLTVEQQQGIFAWMRHIRETTIAESGGTRTGTRQQLQEREGMSIDEFVAARRDMALLQQLRRDKIEPRVIVSWRDVQREYQRRWDEFNPPATLSLARIRLSTDAQVETIEQVKQRLADGEPFAEIAASLDQAEDGRAWQTFQMGAGGIEDISLADRIKQHIIHLQVGETSEPFQHGSSTWWLHIAGIDQPEGRSLYEVQREIQASLHNRRFNEEMNNYIETLFEQGIYDELDSMLLQLLEIATVRYWQ